MKTGKASWTAEITAVFRAVESIRPDGNRLLHDPYAMGFLRPAFRLILRIPPLARFALWLGIERRFPGATATITSRIRFVDDCLAGSLQDGIEQLVILGAGYDSRAYRFDTLRSRRVFEVDHPATQRLKKRKLAKIFGHLPGHVAFVPVDFEKEPFIPKLRGAGYRQDLKTLFIWEGVCKYLTAGAVGDLLAQVSANACKGSAIVFDYLFQSMVDKSSGSPLAEKILDFQAKKGEPFIFGLPEERTERMVMEKGFSNVRNVTAAGIKKMYFKGMARAEKLHPFWGLIHATI